MELCPHLESITPINLKKLLEVKGETVRDFTKKKCEIKSHINGSAECPFSKRVICLNCYTVACGVGTYGNCITNHFNEEKCKPVIILNPKKREIL